ncbi:hypothetical protein [Streptomyces sp. NPDC088141]|uniref:hypothetical protein n=1 Tax=Streptomyces sp. NPDC088141 TaxID=3155179 RepID=UPI00342177D1
MIKPEAIPQYTGNLEQLEKDHAGLKTDAGHIRDTGSSVHTHFQGLSAYYKAPEAEQLFASTKPVKDRADGFADDLEKVASSLSDYATEIRSLVTKLEQLKADATKFVNANKDDDDWEYDEDKVDEHNQLRDDITATVAAFWAAERTCHNKITALIPGGVQMVAGDGSERKDQYGFNADDLKNAKLPWGDPVEEKHHVWEVGHWVKSFVWDGLIVDGVWGTIKGLGTLVGFGGWDAMGQAWKGLAQLATGLVITAVPGAGTLFWALPDDKLPSWLRDSRTAMKETGKALVAWDEWGKNPGRAAGAVTFNVLTTVFTGGAGGAAAGAGKAGAVAKALSVAGKAGKVIDPMTYIAKGTGAGLSKIGDITKGLKGISNIEIPKLPDDAITLPEGSFKLPDGTVHLPEGAAIPEGGVKLPDGNIKFPDDAPLLPENTTKLPTHTNVPVQYFDHDGNLLNEHGDIVQRVEDAPKEGSPNVPHTDGTDPATPHTNTTDPATPDAQGREPALVGVGAHTADNVAHVGANAGDNVIHVGSDLTDPAHLADNLPGTHNPADGLPTGHVGDNLPHGEVGNHLPGGHADDLGHGPTAGHEPPNTHTGGHGDGPSSHDTGGHGSSGHDGPGNHGDGPGTGGDGPGTGGDHVPDGSGGHGDGPGLPEEHVNSLDHPPSEPLSAVRPDGARYVDEPTAHAGQVYDEIRATPDSVDIPEISRHTGIDESVLKRVKTHLFRTEHVVVADKGVAREGLFTPRDDIGDLWKAAGQRSLDADEALKLQRLIAHEYMESHLMEAGLPYVFDRPQSWEVDMVNGVPDGHYRAWPESWVDAGAHELTVSERKGGFAQWEGLGLDAPKIELAPDLSNINEVMEAAFQELRSKGLDLK